MKTTLKGLSAFLAVVFSITTAFSQAPAASNAIMLQGFYWDSNSETSWSQLYQIAGDISGYFDYVWLPPSAASTGGTGYHPTQLSTQNSAWGTEAKLRLLIAALKSNNCKAVADIVVNHRGNVSTWCDFYPDNFGGSYGNWQFNAAHIVSNDPGMNNPSSGGCYHTATGAAKPGQYEMYDAARNLDQTHSYVQSATKAYLQYLKNEIGYDGWRYDFAKGFAPSVFGMYSDAAGSELSVGEYWEGDYNAVWNWITGTSYKSMAFDFPMKYAALNSGLASDKYANMAWNDGSTPRPAGLIHSPQSRRYAVTFVDNHDTYRDGSKYTGDVLKANAFILSSPGIPCVFYPHWKNNKTAIQNMMKARKAVGLNSESTVEVQNTSGYYKAYSVGTNGTMLTYIYTGSAPENPGSGWTLACDGTGYRMYINVTNTAAQTAYDNKIKNGVNPAPLPTFNSIKITATVPATWTAPKIHVWNTSGEVRITSAAWPGDAMTKVSGNTWTITLSGFTTDEVGVVVNNGAPSGTIQTVDLFTTGDICWLLDNAASMGGKYGATEDIGCGAPPIVGSITAPAGVCPGASLTLPEAPTVSGAISQGWQIYRNNVWITFANPVTSADTQLRYFATNTYGTNYSNAVNVTINTVPTVGNIATAPDAVCTGADLTLPAMPTITGSTTSQGWQVYRNNAWVAFANPVTSADTQLRYFATNACGTTYSSNAVNITINAVPAAPASINGSAAVCSGSAQSYSAATVSGATSYEWTLPAGWTGGSTTSVINATAGSAAGTIQVKAKNTCGESAAASLLVSIATSVTPSVSIGTGNGLTVICAGELVNFTASAGNGGTTPAYQWLKNGQPVGTNAEVYSDNTLATGDVITCVMTSNSDCVLGDKNATSNAITMTVNTPPASFELPAEEIMVCTGTSRTYSIAPVSGATSYEWTLPPGWSSEGSTTNSIDATAGATGGSIVVRAINNCGASMGTFGVAIYAIPVQPSEITGATLVFKDVDETYSLTGMADIDYDWTVPAGWTIKSGNGTSSIVVTAGAGAKDGDITATPTNRCGITGQSRTLAVTVDSPNAINEVAAARVLIYPNPVESILNIDAENEIAKVTVFSASGQKMMMSNKQFIDVSALYPGFYFLKVEFANAQMAFSKFLKR